MKDRN